jgi:hypothetical protein
MRIIHDVAEALFGAVNIIALIRFRLIFLPRELATVNKRAVWAWVCFA